MYYSYHLQFLDTRQCLSEKGLKWWGSKLIVSSGSIMFVSLVFWPEYLLRVESFQQWCWAVAFGLLESGFQGESHCLFLQGELFMHWTSQFWL